jgi:uncharacterized damage-inducible protein DinB
MSPTPSATSPIEAHRIADQLERAFEGDAWNGPTVTEILSGVSAEQAAARPVAGAHSIWEIVLHTTAWQRTVRERLQGHSVEPLADDLDWPLVADTSEAAWAGTIRDLRAEYERLRQEAEVWRDRDLSITPGGERYTAYEMLHGVIQHIYYHAGQITILKKAQAGASR